eukprot:355627-Chlamydomonas_euryale.AAC.1
MTIDAPTKWGKGAYKVPQRLLDSWSVVASEFLQDSDAGERTTRPAVAGWRTCGEVWVMAAKCLLRMSKALALKDSFAWSLCSI